jgi:hypothetical protein
VEGRNRTRPRFSRLPEGRTSGTSLVPDRRRHNGGDSQGHGMFLEPAGWTGSGPPRDPVPAKPVTGAAGACPEPLSAIFESSHSRSIAPGEFRKSAAPQHLRAVAGAARGLANRPVGGAGKSSGSTLPTYGASRAFGVGASGVLMYKQCGSSSVGVPVRRSHRLSEWSRRRECCRPFRATNSDGKEHPALDSREWSACRW